MHRRAPRSTASSSWSWPCSPPCLPRRRAQLPMCVVLNSLRCSMRRPIFVGEVFVVGCSNLLYRVEHTAQMRLHCLHRTCLVVSQNTADDYFVLLEYLAQPVRVLER